MWARCLAARFASPVLLVGSALYSEKPRDIDIRVIMDGEHFDARYGPWADGPSDIWVRDVAKLSREMAIALRMNVDIQVMPDYHHNGPHAGTPQRILAVP